MSVRRRWIRWLAILGGWTLVGLFFSTQIYFIYSVLEQKRITWLRAIRATVPDWYIWAVFAPFILRLARRFPADRDGWKKALAIHLPASLLFATLHLVIGVTLLYVFDPAYPRTWAKAFKFNFGFLFHWNVLTYFAIAGFSYAAEYYRSFQERKVQAVQLEAQLSHAQLQALKMQLHPHFLFNTLNSISSLLQTSRVQHEDVQMAKKMIVRLGDFLRLTLQNSGAQKVPLSQELEFLKTYLEIEKVRFQDRLNIQLNVASDTRKMVVPNLILQPFVENAIEHGIASRSEPGTIMISAERTNGYLRLEVSDNGCGLTVSESGRYKVTDGLGLANTRARLQQLYGDSFRLDLKNRAEGGVSVTVEIPAEEVHD
jgi:two-component system LytT family sensor kinase